MTGAAPDRREGEKRKKKMMMMGAVALGMLGAGIAWAEAVEHRDYDAAKGK